MSVIIKIPIFERPSKISESNFSKMYDKNRKKYLDEIRNLKRKGDEMSILKFEASASAINDFISWIESNEGQKAFDKFNRQNHCNCFLLEWGDKDDGSYYEGLKISSIKPAEYAGNVILTFEQDFGPGANVKNGITKLVKALFNEYNEFTTTQRGMNNGRLIFQKIKEWNFIPYLVTFDDGDTEQFEGVQVVIEVDDE